MDITLQPGKLSVAVTVPPSKSMAHRMLICAAFADKPTTLICPETSDDIEATVDCLRAWARICNQRTQATQFFLSSAYRKVQTYIVVKVAPPCVFCCPS